jgi:hypothetical protein
MGNRWQAPVMPGELSDDEITEAIRKLEQGRRLSQRESAGLRRFTARITELLASR